MINMTFTDNNKIKYKRVNKTTARRAFNEGCVVVLCPSNLRPFSPWHNEAGVIKDRCEGADFEKVVNAFSYYNCINNETGRGLSQ